MVSRKLDCIWTFLQVPYRSGKVAAEVNGIWDSAFMTWAEVAESQLGAECEIVPGVEKILQFVRKSSLTGHVVWPDQERCDYPGVALCFFLTATTARTARSALMPAATRRQSRRFWQF